MNLKRFFPNPPAQQRLSRVKSAQSSETPSETDQLPQEPDKAGGGCGG